MTAKLFELDWTEVYKAWLRALNTQWLLEHGWILRRDAKLRGRIGQIGRASALLRQQLVSQLDFVVKFRQKNRCYYDGRAPRRPNYVLAGSLQQAVLSPGRVADQ